MITRQKNILIGMKKIIEKFNRKKVYTKFYLASRKKSAHVILTYLKNEHLNEKSS